METDIREKLRSDAQCLTGILNHTCPFRYEELMVLTSGVLERQRVISYNTNKVLPMVGYLLKSRSLTETLKATFFALEKINNVTIAKDKNQEEIFFNNVYDEITRGDIGGNGIKIVETKNDEASSHSWEDDEFDEALRNPVVKKEQIPGYPIKKPKPNPDTGGDDDDEPSDEEGASESEEGREPPPPSQDDYNDSDSAGSQEHEAPSSFKDVPLPPLYGLSYQNEPPVFPKRTKNRE
jgi:hypothetical protein